MEPNRGRWLKQGGNVAFYSFVHPQSLKRWNKGQIGNAKMLCGHRIALPHCTLPSINKFIRTKTKAWDSPGPISCYHCHPQGQNLGNSLGTASRTGQYVQEFPLGAGFFAGLSFVERTSGPGEEKQLVKTDRQLEQRPERLLECPGTCSVWFQVDTFMTPLKTEQRWADEWGKWCLSKNIRIIVAK